MIQEIYGFIISLIKKDEDNREIYCADIRGFCNDFLVNILLRLIRCTHKYWVDRWMDSLLGNRSLWVKENEDTVRKGQTEI